MGFDMDSDSDDDEQVIDPDVEREIIKEVLGEDDIQGMFSRS